MVPSTSQSFAPGHEAEVYTVGDFILTHHGHWIGAAIRFGQGLRFRGSQRPYAYWNHAALIVSEQGDLVEALTKTGATRSHISKYLHTEYTLVRVYAEPLDQKQILRFADKIVGQKYGYWNDLWSLFNYLTPVPFNISTRNHVECAGLVAQGQLRLGAYFDQPADFIWPAALALYYDVKLPNAAKK